MDGAWKPINRGDGSMRRRLAVIDEIIAALGSRKRVSAETACYAGVSLDLPPRV